MAQGTRSRTRAMIEHSNGAQPGDPDKAAAAIIAALDADQTPLHLPLGDDAHDGIAAHLDALRADMVAWQSVTRATAFD